MKKIFLNILGVLFLVLAVIGLILPLIPAIPFLICATACFGSSNSKIYDWLAGNKYFGEYVRSYREKTGMSNQARNRALFFLWFSIAVSAAIAGSKAASAVLGVAGACITVYIIRMARGAKAGVMRLAHAMH